MQFKIFLILCSVGWSLQNVEDNEIGNEKPLKEAINNIKNEQILDNLGGLLTNFMQNGGAKVLLENVLQNQGGAGAGGILDALSSLASHTNNDDKDDDSAGDMLKGLGSLASIVGAFQGGGNNDANPLGMLQGLGSLFSAGQNNKGIDPKLLGSIVNLFSEDTKKKPSTKKSGKDKLTKKDEKVNQSARKSHSEDFNLGDMLTMASSFMGDSGKNLLNKGIGDFLPMIMQTINAFSGPEASQRSESHSSHVGIMPSIVEKAHIFFDHFLHSELGKSILATVGGDKTFKVFLDEDNKFSYEKFIELIENQSFRKHWIQKVTVRLIHLIQSTTKEMNFLPVLESGRAMFNGFFKNQGFPKKILLDFKDPVESISGFVDYFCKVYLDLAFTSKPYVKPAVKYATDVYHMAKESLGSHREPKELSDKLADTINLDIIEPIVRVNRAYRFAKNTPSCDRYVFCTINQAASSGDETLPGLKKLLTRANSVILGWFLSSHTKTSFWDLYEDITVKKSCKSFYNAECEGFHDAEMKVTTEYVHNEL